MFDVIIKNGKVSLPPWKTILIILIRQYWLAGEN